MLDRIAAFVPGALIPATVDPEHVWPGRPFLRHGY